jgi:phosphoglycerol transferase MdoB-like AlkP superfamily enzyme
MLNKIPPHFRLLLTLIVLDVVLFGLFRVVFYKWFSVLDSTITQPMLLKAFYLGFKFDLKLALLINLPIFLLGWFKPFNAVKSFTSRNFWLIYLLLIHGIIVFLYFIDLGHYDYLRLRVDVSVIRFLQDLAISKQMVGESYPVAAILTGYAILLLLLGWIFNYLLQRAQYYPATDYKGWKKYTLAFTALVVFTAGIYGKFSYYPLRWSDAFFSTNNFISALTSNPVLYFYETLKNRESGFDFEKAKKYYPLMAEYLEIEQKANNPGENVSTDAVKIDFIRVEKSHSPISVDKPNIVLVFLESFGFYKTGLSGNPLDPTPHFDAMAKKGILFDRYYVPHGGTARSVFTLVTGIPDIETVKTSTRNPMVVDQQSIINSFSGYEKFYFLGGSVSWGNIRGLLSGNIPDLKIYGEGSYKSPREDVWGISDLHLFEEANVVLRESKKPFFAIIQTAGNHRPYTIPDDNRGFKVNDVKADEVAPYGFRSVGDYNSFRFMDHSLGVFLKQLEKEPYAQNTIFVFFGDHGNDREAKHMFPGEEQLMLTEYHVPLVFYAPGLITQAKMISTVASEVDVLPTVASLAGLTYTNTTFGRDLFNPEFDDKRYAFTFERIHPPMLGLIGDEYYFKMRDDDTDKQLYNIHSATPKKNLSKSLPDLSAKLAELAQAYYESIRYIRYNNGSNNNSNSNSNKINDANNRR